MDGFSECFSRRPQRDAASRYLDGLFNDSERKSMQAMHGRLSDPASYQALQHFITDSPWDAARVWMHLRTLVPVRTGILALDDTGFPKQGTRSVGVQRQYCGALGKIGNCQVAVSSVLIADARTWPLTFELYLPKSWMSDPARCEAAGVPPTVRFREKWRIALAHVRTVLKAGFTVTGVVVDADYGANAQFRDGLERLGLAYGVAIRGDVTFTTAGATRLRTAAVISAATATDAWQSVTWGTRTTGPLTAAFVALRVRARKGRTIVITSRDEPALEGLIDHEIRIPETVDMLTPILASVPLQLLAYYIAVQRGANVDQPRNLAKSVTVE